MDCLLLDGNETLWFVDTWTVVTENKTIGRETLVNWIQDKLTVFGSILSIWIVISNLFLICTAFLRPLLDSVRETSRSMRISLSVVQVLIGGVAIPVNLVTYARGRWIFGRAMCNASLLGQMFLVANTAWTLVALTFDLVIRTLWPALAGVYWWTGLGLLGAWIMAALSVLPMALHLELGDPLLLQDMCAVVMTKEAAVLLSLAVFLLPAAISATGCIAIMVTRWRLDRRSQAESHMGCSPAAESVSVLVARWPDATAKPEVRCCSTSGSPDVALVAANACCIVAWSPFFVVNALVSFCADMCIDPGAWSLLLWFGYLAPALLPLTWLIDRGMRLRLREALTGSGRATSEKVTCCNVRASFDAKSQKEPENEVLL